MLRKRISIQGFELTHFAAEITLKHQFCALFTALKHPGALRARDLLVAFVSSRSHQLPEPRRQVPQSSTHGWAGPNNPCQLCADLHPPRQIRSSTCPSALAHGFGVPVPQLRPRNRKPCSLSFRRHLQDLATVWYKKPRPRPLLSSSRCYCGDPYFWVVVQEFRLSYHDMDR